MKVLANDGISQAGLEKLQAAGFEVIEKKVPQDELIDYINKNQIAILLVRSATKVRRDLITNCEGLKLIGRGGVGLDNIDVAYAKERGITVLNTPSASARSVAELVIAQLLTGVRHLHKSNREMPLEGETNFKALKKEFKGTELYGKTLGLIGFGRIGRTVAQLALGIGMEVIVYDIGYKDQIDKPMPVSLIFSDGQRVQIEVQVKNKEQLLKTADFISLHVPAQQEYVIGKKELEMMKDTAGLINLSRGGVIDEKALIEALENDKLAFAALDVYEKEPTPSVQLLMNSKISFTPHIGGATAEAQERIGLALAEQIIGVFGKQN